MLVLSRKVDQTINIHVDGKIVQVTINKINGSRVSLGLTAAKEVNIMRAEVDPYSSQKNSGPTIL